MSRRSLFIVIVAVIVAAAVAGGVLLWRWATPPALANNAAPATVARTYFQLDASGRSWAAKRYVWDSGRSDAPDGHGYGGAKILSVSAARPTSKRGYAADVAALAELRSVHIHYHSTLTSEIGEPPGDYDTWVLLGRETPTGPWRVVYTGFPL